ncbi:acyltransferase [Bacteroides ihuae]|uniref:acyltransferase n=1 Tax=Bacteroides ihuae TaxID=1852362 RepID=UPI0008DB2514|nr:acyltransferase [Bacteroides ihuae]
MRLKNNRFLRTIYYNWLHYEAKHSYNHGKGNVIVNKGVKVKSRIQIRGSHNYVIIEGGAAFLNTTLRITGNNCMVVLKDHSYVTEAEIFVENNNCKVEIGSKTFVGRHTHIACSEDNSELIIGRDGMISSHCQVRTGDSHSVTDLEGNRINPAASIHIGDHCWLGEGSKVMKGVTLGKDTVVSTGAIVTKSFEPNVLLGGIPAKVLKKNVSWNEKIL